MNLAEFVLVQSFKNMNNLFKIYKQQLKHKIRAKYKIFNIILFNT